MTLRILLQILRGGLEALERLRIDARVVAVLREERVAHDLGDRGVDVVAAEERVAGGREDLEERPRQVEQGAVERPAAEVVDRDSLALVAPEPVRERGGRRLVQDAEDLEPGDAARDLRRGALKLVEMRGHRDDRLVDRLAERGLRDLADALEHERADSQAGCTPRRGR